MWKDVHIARKNINCLSFLFTTLLNFDISNLTSNTRISDRYFANKSSPVSPIPRANATEIPIVTPTSNSVIQQEKGFQLSYDTTSDEKQDRVKYAGEQRPIPTFSAHALDRRDTPRPDPEEVKSKWFSQASN